MERYEPELPSEFASIADLTRFVVAENRRIANALAGALPQPLEELHVPPARVRDFMIVAADGVNWNPGQGKGVYAYFLGGWHKLDVTTGLIIGKTPGLGIKVDLATPTFPWHDLLGQIRARGVGATDPNDVVYRGGIRQFQFDVNDEVWNEFHIPHDYVPGSDIHLHAHWSHDGTLVTGGNVTWGFEVTYSKGHNQAPFGAPVTRTVAGGASAVQYQHIITETQISAATPAASQIDSDLLEVDGILLVRTFLSANGITVSGGPVPKPFLHYVDVHYQSTGIGTKQKAPDFWV